MPGSLEGVELKVERARGHLNAIDEAIEVFVKTAFEGTLHYGDVHTREHVLQLGPLRHPDHRLAVVVGDFLHNMRSAFDHLAYQLVQFPIEDGGPKTPGDKIAFPLTDNPTAFDRSKGKIRGAAPGVEAIVESHQPYNSGQPFLWFLHELNNWDKHRVLHLVENTVTDFGFLNPEHILTANFHPAGELEADAELARWKLKPGTDPNVDVGIYFASQVAFEDGPAAGWQVHGTLEAMLIFFDSAANELTPFIDVA
jgi:hypothetical protein